MEPNTHYFYEEMALRIEEPNSAIIVHWQGIKETPKNRVLNKILQKMLYESCFNTLRTNEQLGYAVSWYYLLFLFYFLVF